MLSLALLLLTHSTIQPQGSEVRWKYDQVQIFLHRAASLAFVENTVPSLEAAVKQGADGVEIDVRRTKDGALVLYHDDWLLRYGGPSSTLEELTLADTQNLNLSLRFGNRAKGQRPPLFADVLRFAKANGLLLFLDIKTKGIYPEVMRLVDLMGCRPLVQMTGGQVPSGNFSVPMPWIRVWNYDKGGEEDPDRMRAALANAPAQPYRIMAEDARLLSHLLGRRPQVRPFSPFRSTMARALRDRANIMTTMTPPPSWFRSRFERDAESHPDMTLRQKSLWSLGSMGDALSVPTILRIALTPYDAKVAATHEYAESYVKFAACAALARIPGPESRAAIRKVMVSKGEMDRGAMALTLAVLGSKADAALLAEMADSRKENIGMAASSVITSVGWMGSASIPIYIAGLEWEDTAKWAVFGLANLGSVAIEPLVRTATDVHETAKRRRGAVLAILWMQGPEAERTRRRLAVYAGLPNELRSLIAAWLPVPR